MGGQLRSLAGLVVRVGGLAVEVRQRRAAHAFM